MASTESAMGRFVSTTQLRVEDFLADQGFSSETHPHAAKMVSALALFGIYCVSRKLFNYSKSFAKYTLNASPSLSNTTLAARYVGTSQSFVMVLNTVDQLGNAYCH